MATIKVTNEVELMLSRLHDRADGMCKKALYEGAKVLADAMKSEIEGLPTDDRGIHIEAGSTDVLQGPRARQKAGLLESMGVAVFRQEKGGWTTHLGFDGRNDIQTARWTGGQPNSMVARSVNAGTYFMRANPFIDRTRSQYAKAAQAAMEETIKSGVAEENN